MTAQTFISNQDSFVDDFQAYDRRPEPYAHPSWLAKALAGDRQCFYSMYGQANYYLPKADNSFDAEAFKLKHQSILMPYADQLRAAGFKVYTEDSNAFKVTSKGGAVISGQPDIVALQGDEMVIVDIKTGKPAAKDMAQVKLYMALAPAVQLHGIKAVPVGRLFYEHGNMFEIEPDEITDEFKQQTHQLIRAIAGDDAPEPTPSAQECRWCPVAHICSHSVATVAEGEADWL